jgi:hypothetical protein
MERDRSCWQDLLMLALAALHVSIASMGSDDRPMLPSARLFL